MQAQSSQQGVSMKSHASGFNIQPKQGLQQSILYP